VAGGGGYKQDAPEAQGIFDAVAADAEPVCFEGQLISPTLDAQHQSSMGDKVHPRKDYFRLSKCR